MQREIVNYAHLTETTLAAIKNIIETMSFRAFPRLEVRSRPASRPEASGALERVQASSIRYDFAESGREAAPGRPAERASSIVSITTLPRWGARFSGLRHEQKYRYFRPRPRPKGASRQPLHHQKPRIAARLSSAACLVGLVASRDLPTSRRIDLTGSAMPLGLAANRPGDSISRQPRPPRRTRRATS